MHVLQVPSNFQYVTGKWASSKAKVWTMLTFTLGENCVYATSNERKDSFGNQEKPSCPRVQLQTSAMISLPVRLQVLLFASKRIVPIMVLSHTYLHFLFFNNIYKPQENILQFDQKWFWINRPVFPCSEACHYPLLKVVNNASHLYWEVL